MKRLSILAVMALAAVMVPAQARGPARVAEASIPFANHGGVDDWRATDDHTIYFKDSHRQWYRAEIFGPAFDLPYVENIGIDPSPSGALDRWSAIVVRGQRYHFRSFEKIAGQPPRRRHH
jgi:hypothetical protein